MNKTELIHNLCRSDRPVQYKGDLYSHSVLKVHYVRDIYMIYGCSVYHANGAITYCDHGSSLNYMGILDIANGELYDASDIPEIEGLTEKDCRDLGDWTDDLATRISQRLGEHVTQNPEVFTCDKQFSDAELIVMRRDALRAFYTGKEITDFLPYVRSEKIPTIDVITSLVDVEPIICRHVEQNASEVERLAEASKRHETRRKMLVELVADTKGEHYLRRAIAECITDQQTVRVTVRKNAEELTFTTKASSLSAGEYVDYYSNHSIAASDRKMLCAKLGDSYEIRPFDIIGICHGRKILFDREQWEAGR